MAALRHRQPWAGKRTRFVRGSIFNQSARLVARQSQEGLIRKREDWARLVDVRHWVFDMTAP